MTNPNLNILHEDSWAAHLDAAETLIWTGLPIRAFRWHTQGWFASSMLVGQITLGLLAVSFLSMAIVPILGLHPLLIALVFFGPGLALLSMIALWHWLQRRSARYALTSKRAIIAQRFPMKRLKSYPIYRDKPILVGKTTPKSLFFAHKDKQVNFTTFRRCYGFDHLEDFAAALKHATSIQETAPLRPRDPVYKAFEWTSQYPQTNTG